MSFGALAFLNPWLLAALATLPIIYWLLRTVPPSPHRVTFPPTRILVGLENQEKTPAASPWWLTLIRLLAAALLDLRARRAGAEPFARRPRSMARARWPSFIDNGWASASHWDERTRMVDRIISEAESKSRPVVIVPTASTAKVSTARIEAPAEARSTAAALNPQPFAPDRLAAVSALEAALAGAKGASIVWLSDDIDHDGKAADVAAKLRELAQGGTFAVIEDGRATEPLGVAASIGQSGKLEARVLRPHGGARSGFVHAISTRGQSLAEAPFQISSGASAATVSFELPLELRNQVGRVEIAGERSAGAVSLIDARSQWHRVALISGENLEQAQPLLAPLYYIEKALNPYAELIKPKGSNLAAGIQEALSQNASVLMLADIGTLSGEAAKHVEEWVKKGGVLVRFAGSRLENGGDELLPVPLRVGGRTLGGALSWSTPQKLAPIEDTSLFAGTPVPPEVTVSRQVLADPAMLGPDVHVWARLQDGTPLVTERKFGEGQIILFHVTANSDWSNLPLSGLFVEMLRRISALGSGVADGGGTGHGQRGRRSGCAERAAAAADARRFRHPRAAAADGAAGQRRQGARPRTEPRSPAGILWRRRLAACRQRSRPQEHDRAPARAARRHRAPELRERKRPPAEVVAAARRPGAAVRRHPGRHTSSRRAASPCGAGRAAAQRTPALPWPSPAPPRC